MEYCRLGNTGVKVSRICLGTGFRGHLDEATCSRVIGRALDLGCNFIDCANVYGGGRSEEILGRAIRGKREELVITTKVWSPVGQGPNDRGLSRFHLLREVERSLRRLQTDHLDLYFLHHVDPETPFEETLRTLEDLVRQGKVRYTGASNYQAWQVAELLGIAQAHGWERIACLQNQYNLLQRRKIEPDLLPLCKRYGLGLITYSPLAVGLLTGRFRRGQELPADTPWTPERLKAILSERVDQVIQALVEIGQARGRTPAQIALAWILDHPEVTAPIIGPDLPEQVEEAFGALEFRLEPEERERLDHLSQWEEPGEYL